MNDETENAYEVYVAAYERRRKLQADYREAIKIANAEEDSAWSTFHRLREAWKEAL